MAANRTTDSLDIINKKISSYNTGVQYDDELLHKKDSDLTGYDKATLNMNPDLKAKRNSVQNLISQRDDLQNRQVNIESAQQYLQDNVNQQRDRINKLYDLQDRAAAISASIQGTNRTAGGLGAASNVLGNSRGITDAQMQQQILQNDAQRESALSNVAQQEANIPSVLASLDQANANSELARAQARYYNNQNTSSGGSSGGSYSNRNNNNNNNEKLTYEEVNGIDGVGGKLDGNFIKFSNGDYYDGNTRVAYTDEKGNIIYTKEGQKLFGLDEVKSNNTGNRMPSSTVLPTLNPTLGTGNNVSFTRVGNRVSL